MRNEIRAAVATAILTSAIAFVFTSVLHASQSVVPLFLVPVFLYAGYAVATCGFKLWLAVTLVLSLGMVVLYAMP
jgi:hypothetical protein